MMIHAVSDRPLSASPRFLNFSRDSFPEPTEGRLRFESPRWGSESSSSTRHRPVVTPRASFVLSGHIVLQLHFIYFRRIFEDIRSYPIVIKVTKSGWSPVHVPEIKNLANSTLKKHLEFLDLSRFIQN